MIQFGEKGPEREKKKLQKEWEQEAFGENLVKETEIPGTLIRKWRLLLFEADSKTKIQIKNGFLNTDFLAFLNNIKHCRSLNSPIRVKNNVYLLCVAPFGWIISEIIEMLA